MAITIIITIMNTPLFFYEDLNNRKDEQKVCVERLFHSKVTHTSTNEYRV